MARISNRYAHLKKVKGMRSGLESQVAAQLDALGVEYEYEKATITYHRPTKSHHYTPDFVLSNGIIIEAKGWFKTEDRHKHRLIQSQRPDLDIRFVFSRPHQKISKQSRTTYALWCTKNGFKFAPGPSVPKEWIDEHHA